MARFFVAISNEDMARQIATLINAHNRLYKRYNARSVENENADYFVEVVGGTVVGCVGVSREGLVSRIKHVCVLPECRQKGIAKKLVGLALSKCLTQEAIMTIREDNEASLQMAKSMGFQFSHKFWNRDHNVVVVRRQIHGRC